MNKFHRLVFVNNKTKYLDGKEVDKFIIEDCEVEIGEHSSQYVCIDVKLKKLEK